MCRLSPIAVHFSLCWYGVFCRQRFREANLCFVGMPDLERAPYALCVGMPDLEGGPCDLRVVGLPDFAGGPCDLRVVGMPDLAGGPCDLRVVGMPGLAEGPCDSYAWVRSNEIFHLHNRLVGTEFFNFFNFLGVGWERAHFERPQFDLLYQPQMIGDGECGAIGGMRVGRGNRSTRRKPVRATVRNRRLTAWAIAQPLVGTYISHFIWQRRGRVVSAVRCNVKAFKLCLY
jgi:hypothetical protein